MSETFLKPIILVTEGATDAAILCSLVNAGDRVVYTILAQGYNNIASTIRTQYLMNGDSFYYVAVFDTDSSNDAVCDDRISAVDYLSGAYMHPGIIHVIPAAPSIDILLRIPSGVKANRVQLTEYVKNNIEELKENPLIKALQKAFDKCH